MKIDRFKIPTCTNADVQSIGLIDGAYEEAELDAGVVIQASEALRRNNPALNNLQKNLNNVVDDIKYTEVEIREMEKLLDQMLTDFNKNDKSADRKIRRLESQIEVKMTLVDTLRKRKDSYKKKLQDFLKAQEMLDSSGSPVQCRSRRSEEDASDLPAQTNNMTRSQSTPALASRSHKVQVFKSSKADDADLIAFQKRVRHYQRTELLNQQLTLEHGQIIKQLEDHVLEGGLNVPGDVWNRLYDYQREGVNWLWSLHQNGIGGILGDDMGLGKTIQVIAFLAALRHSQLSTSGGSFEVAVSQMKTHYKSAHEDRMLGLGPVLIVCPGTVLNQWLAEFRAWIPTTRVVILHSSGSGYSNLSKLITSLFSTSGIVLTTYGTLTLHRDLLLPLAWHYIILDEGHKIKNPDADITTTVKRFTTPHRLIVSGTPMQNNLKELWSIFDFIYPGKLGGLSDFLQNFAVPITQGGYANSSPIQVEIAYRCACTLKNLLAPYLLRRLKLEVNLKLPKKSEQVLFCRLTNYQRNVYEEYLNSKSCLEILNGKGLVFKGLILMKALCNHPDLVTGGPRHFGSHFNEDQEELLTGHFTESTPSTSAVEWNTFGCPRRSGKLMVTLDLLRMWHEQGHKVLVFTQSRRMLRLLEKHVTRLDYAYLKMDGTTTIGQRPKLIERFNSSPQTTCFVFLLTTRVGGLGVNLTGANRVLIYDPDWNPSTDAQARERAWRIGQLREVMIYRLITSGTIEEKVYQRQIFKQFLTNRVLKNPRQQRFFKLNDLVELFTLGEKEVQTGDSKHGRSSNESVAFFKSMGIEKSISRTLTSTVDNRFDKLFSNKDAIPTADQTESEPDQADEEKGEEQTEEEKEEDREYRLRTLAKKLSRQLCADESGEIRREEKKKRKRKHGTRIDGRRILLIDRSSHFDEGVDDDEDRCSSSKRRTLPNSLYHGIDPFVASLLCRSGVDNEAPSGEMILNRVAEIQTKRAKVDEQIALEAVRVAEAALERIGAKPSSSSSSRHLHSTSHHRHHKHRSSKKSTPRNLIGVQNRLPSSFASSVCPLSLRGVTAVDHDRLLADYLLSANSIDPTFEKLQADRLVSSIFAWLSKQAHRVGRLQEEGTDAISGTVTDHRFGLLKQRYLWNPGEESSPLYKSLIKTDGAQIASGSFFVAGVGGHHRLSSCLLLRLVRMRRDHSLSFLGLSASANASLMDSSTSTDGTNLILLEKKLRRIAVDLLFVFTERFSSTSSSTDKLSSSSRILETKFNQILSAVDTDKTISVTAHQIRALLRMLATPATPRNAPNSSRHSRRREEDVWELKPQFAVIARRLALDPAAILF